jgi:hypothetical protein
LRTLLKRSRVRGVAIHGGLEAETDWLHVASVAERLSTSGAKNKRPIPRDKVR